MKKIGQLEINYISHSMYLIQCGFKNSWAEVMSLWLWDLWDLASSKPARKTHRHKHTQRNFSKISTTLCSRMHKAYHLSFKLLIINTASVPPTRKWRKLHKSMDMKKVGITKVILKSVHHGAQVKLF